MLSDEEKRNFRAKTLSGLASFVCGREVLLPPSNPRLACVYALEMSDGTIKIGVTRNLEKRIKAVSGAVYLDVLNVHHTGFAPFGFMHSVEKECHQTFSDKRVRGEFFDIKFEEACAELDRHKEAIDAARKAADQKIRDEMEYFEELKAERRNQSPSIRKSEPAAVELSWMKKAVCEIMETATIIRPMFMVNWETALSSAIDLMTANSNIDFSWLKQLLPPKEPEPRYLTPAQIGERLGGLSEEDVKQMLADYGLQYYDGKHWRLEDEARPYGDELSYTEYPDDYESIWTLEVVELLREHAFNKIGGLKQRLSMA